MEIRYPTYYTQFHCVAGDCPDSCCKDWSVQIDPKSAAFYRTLSGPLGDALRASLADEDGDTILTLTPDKRCPMWRKDGLCRIQADLGEDALSQVCRDFPRLRHDYGNFVELGLEMSCPEAARIILSQTDSGYVIQSVPGDIQPEYDTEVMDILLAGRAQLLSILQQFPPQQALAIMLLHGYHVQAQLDGAEITAFSPESAITTAKSLAQPGTMDALLRFYKDLEILTEQWLKQLNMPQDSAWSQQLLAFARYGVERYYLQAISDYDLIGRIKMIIVSCLIVKAVGGDIVDTAQRYAKEVENDYENVEAILNATYTHPAFTDIKLLGLLISDE